MEYITAAAIVFLTVGGPAAACPPEIPAAARQLAMLRTLPERFSPPCRTVPAASLHGELDRKLRRDLPLPPETYLEAVARIGLIPPPDSTLYQRLLAFYASQVLGFYEPSADQMVVVEGSAAPPAAAPLVWAHELAHAAQEARFGLPSRILALGDNADAQRAAAAAAEGDATLVMFLLTGPGGADNLLEPAAFRSAQVSALGTYGDIPRFFLEELVFPYAAGYELVFAAYRRGGWSAVDRILADPPGSTAEILQPHRPPPGPPLPDSTLPSPPPGFQVVLTNTMGEWGLRQWLGRTLPASEAEHLASGWDADRFRLIRHGDNPDRWALAWRFRLRSEGARQRLEAALRRVAPAHLRGLTGTGTAPSPAWSAEGKELELRAGWPTPPAPPPPG